jgi:acyl CoA:acetate/3-ketoacid CoA transferase alpha subunit
VAMATTRTIVEVENIVNHAELNLELIMTPGIFVDNVFVQTI